MSLRSQTPKCKNCGAELHEKEERVTEYCINCICSDKQIEADASSAWESYLNEKYETREANS